MPSYTYKAQNTTGNIINGTMDATNESFIFKNLKEKGYFPIEIKESTPSRDIKLEAFTRVGLRDISVFCRQFATIINAGLTIVNGLDILRKQTDNKKLRGILDNLFDEVQKGKFLSESMRDYKEFPDFLVNMVEAGETSGKLDEMLDRMAIYYENENKLRHKIRSALTYPIVISVVAIVVVIFLVTKILPMFVDMFASSGAQLPLPTKILLNISYGFTHYWYIIIFVIAMIVIGIQSYLKTKEGRYKFDKLKFYLPILGKVNKKIVTSRFARTMSILITSGIPVVQCMEIIEKVITNSFIEENLERCKDDIKKGLGLSQPLSTITVFPTMLTEMISIGEETGTLDTMLSKTAEFYDQEVEIAVTGLTTLIEPIIIVVLGGVVAFIIISILLPMFGMYQLVGQ